MSIIDHCFKFCLIYSGFLKNENKRFLNIFNSTKIISHLENRNENRLGQLYEALITIKFESCINLKLSWFSSIKHHIYSNKIYLLQIKPKSLKRYTPPAALVMLQTNLLQIWKEISFHSSIIFYFNGFFSYVYNINFWNSP